MLPDIPKMYYKQYFCPACSSKAHAYDAIEETWTTLLR